MPSPLAANVVDAAALADELARFRVVDAAQFPELLAEFTGAGPQALAEYLVGRGVLTPFQAERALAGEARLLVLGPYRLTGTAGRGTFGPLFSALHNSRPGISAVRLFPLRSLWKTRQARQLLRRLSAGLNHPVVVPLRDVDSANGFHYLVWPLVEGGRLADRVAASGPLAPGDAAGVLGHLANALSACHARGLMHGAITPHSVLLTGNGLPRLLEIGAGALLAESLADDESLFDSMAVALAAGTILTFAAPELADDPQGLTAAVDQYALGALGYFAVTGLPPYPHSTVPELLRAKRAEPPPSAAVVNPAVPAELAAVLERMMLPDPGDRFPTLEAVEQRLAALAAVEQPASEPVPVASLSQLQNARGLGGATSPNRPRPATPRTVARDDSDESVRFDLPGAAETAPHALEASPAGGSANSHRPGERPGRAAAETPADLLVPTRPNLDGPDFEHAPKTNPDRTAAASGDSAGGTELPIDPRLIAPTPVRWHTAESDDSASDSPASAPAGSVLWKKMKRNLMFWQAATDVVQVGVYGASATPGQMVKLTVFLHTPDAIAGVRTLARAFQPDSELIGTGYLLREIARPSELAVHLSVANAGVARALLKCSWRGQPQRLSFDLHVPWESPEGPSPGLVSVGLNNVRVGKIEFRLNVRPRKA